MMKNRKNTLVSRVAKSLCISLLVVAISLSATASASCAALPTTVVHSAVGLPDDVLYYVDGQKVSKAAFEKMAPETIANMNVLKGPSVQRVLGNVSEKQAILITTKGNESAALVVELNKKLNRSIDLTGKLLLLDGKEVSRPEFERVLTAQTQQVTALGPEKAVEAYGEKGKNGSVSITTR